MNIDQPLLGASQRLFDAYWRKWLGNEPVLYHYTNPAGLLGIIRTRQMWLTSAAYLNDSTELQEAGRVTRNALKSLMQVQDDREHARTFFDYLATVFDDAASAPRLVHDRKVFVGCFSTEGDSLAQWRSYGRGEGGFAIGFKASSVWKTKNQSELKPGCWLLPCEYDADHAEKLTFDYLKDAVNECLSVNPEMAIEEMAYRTAVGARWIGAGIKHSAFRDEHEWRLIYYVFEESLPNLKYRDNATFTPYMSFDFGDKKSFAESIQEVVIGPQRHPDLAESALRDFLQQELGHEVNIRVSSVPFRAV